MKIYSFYAFILLGSMFVGNYPTLGDCCDDIPGYKSCYRNMDGNCAGGCTSAQCFIGCDAQAYNYCSTQYNCSNDDCESKKTKK